MSHQPDKGLDFKRDLSIPDKLGRENWRQLEYWDKARKKYLTVKRPEGDKDQDLLSGTKGDMCRRSRDHIRPSKSSISKSERFRRKFMVENYQLIICEKMDDAKQRWNHMQHLCIFVISAYLLNY